MTDPDDPAPDAEIPRVDGDDAEHLPADAPDDNPDDLTVQGGE